MSLKRCPWVDESKPDYVAYHDDEWGVPVFDDQTLFEFLILESAQAGLSWYTILTKRENYRRAFAGFDVNKVARFNARSEKRLMADAGIVRNQLKIRSAITNAQCFLETQSEFGRFSDYLWGFVEGKPIINRPKKLKDYPASTALSDSISKDLKRRGYKFVGTTIVYAYLQAVGVVNDHSVNCFRK